MKHIFYIMGKSSSGKDTLYRLLKEEMPVLSSYIMYTTRPMRSGEADGVSYYFVSETQIQRAEELGKLIEKRTYQTVQGPWTYATLDDGQFDLEKHSMLMTGTLESYENMRRYFGSELIVPLYIEVEDGERLLRAIRREQEQAFPSYRELCRRFLADSEDFSEEKLKNAGISERFSNNDLQICLQQLTKRIRELDYD